MFVYSYVQMMNTTLTSSSYFSGLHNTWQWHLWLRHHHISTTVLTLSLLYPKHWPWPLKSWLQIYKKSKIQKTLCQPISSRAFINVVQLYLIKVVRSLPPQAIASSWLCYPPPLPSDWLSVSPFCQLTNYCDICIVFYPYCFSIISVILFNQ